jgi:hypothetical protein
MKKVTKTSGTASKTAKPAAALNSANMPVTNSANAVVLGADHLTAMVGREVYVSCTSYAYSGVLLGVTPQTIEVDCPSIVYETGPWNSPVWKDAQSLPTNTVVIFKSQIEGIFAVTR